MLKTNILAMVVLKGCASKYAGEYVVHSGKPSIALHVCNTKKNIVEMGSLYSMATWLGDGL
jgi:hypothetical protein